jgi:thiamine biosynthesis protein ThiS
MMKITCNGQERHVGAGMTITGFIRELGLDPESIVVEYNGRILATDEHDHQALDEGATLELIRFVGGG